MTSTVSSSDPGGAGQRSGPLLILNCAEDRLQICLADEGRLMAHQDWVVPGRAMSRLAPALDQVLTAFHLKARDLSGIACVRGPGGFTGIRLCLATACGLSVGAGLPLAGLDYLPLLASGPAALLQGRLAVLTHARRGLIHAQIFAVPECAPLIPPRVMAAESPDLPGQAGDMPLWVLGSGVRRNLETLTATVPWARVLDPVWDHPRPETLIRAALQARFGHEPIEPLYLRPCDAEENLEAIAAMRGLGPGEARQQLDAGLKDIP